MRRLISNLNLAIVGAVAAFLPVSFGCRHADVNRELVERELRLQEDELYRLHDEIAQSERQLEAAQSKNEVLERELQQARAGGPVAPEVLPTMPPAPPESSRDRAPRPDSGVPPLDVAPPTVIVPGLEGPPPAAPGRSSWKSTRGVRAASLEVPIDAAETVEEDRSAESGDDRVTKIVLNRRLTGGYNSDHRLGDEGVIVVIEPRNHDDRLVPLAGDVAIVAIDPALKSDEGRVARWDLSAAEIQKQLHNTGEGEGISLELPWPGEPPAHERLVLFVRCTTSEGELHEASQPILIDLAKDARGTATDGG
jgi:hypothetical protein